MFVNNCRQKRCPTFFNSYFTMRMTQYSLRNRSLEISRSRTNIGYFTVKNSGSRIWNSSPDELKSKALQLNFKKHIARHYLSQYV